MRSLLKNLGYLMDGNSKYEFDVYTEIDVDRAVGITHGFIPSDGHRNAWLSSYTKRGRESDFPLERILQATNVDVKQAQASVESDRKFILNSITGRSVDDAVVDDHSKYDELNNILRGIFVSPALERITKEKDVDTITRCLEIVKASNVRMIYLNLKYCSRFDDDILMKLTDSLPPTLSEFSLWSIGSAVTVNGINACLGKILGCPQLVRLNLSRNNIDDVGAKLIADALKNNHSLSTLDLMVNNIGDDGVIAIADALKVNFSLDLLLLLANDNITARGKEYLSKMRQELTIANPLIEVVWPSKPSISITTGDIESNYQRMRGCNIPEVELRGISIKQLKAVYAEIEARCVVERWTDKDGKSLTPEKCNLYDIKDRIIMKRTESQQCSYVELIATGPQKPTRFVSHWRGQPVIAMIRCLDQHCEDHYLSEETTYYWICAYANNQHKIANEMLTNPFLKAMSICEGTVSILDAECMVYSRIWSFFDVFKSVMGGTGNSDYEFDVYTVIDVDRAVGITHGFIPSDGSPDAPISYYLKKLRESKFPLDRILKATNVNVKQAQASVESDRKFILNSITGRSIDDAVVDDHAKYDELNNILRGIFVTPGLDRIIKEKDVDTIARCLEIVKASNVRMIYLDLKDCSRFDDDMLIMLTDSLPPTLTEFSLVSIGSAVTVNGINACLGKILGCPQLVKLFLSHNNIDDVGAKLIADALKNNHSLNTLDLMVNNIDDDGVIAIADALKVNFSLDELNLLANENITARGKEYLSIMERELTFANPYIHVAW